MRQSKMSSSRSENRLEKETRKAEDNIADLEKAEYYIVEKVLGNALNVATHLSSCDADDRLTAGKRI